MIQSLGRDLAEYQHQTSLRIYGLWIKLKLNYMFWCVDFKRIVMNSNLIDVNRLFVEIWQLENYLKVLTCENLKKALIISRNVKISTKKAFWNLESFKKCQKFESWILKISRNVKTSEKSLNLKKLHHKAFFKSLSLVIFQVKKSSKQFKSLSSVHSFHWNPI